MQKFLIIQTAFIGDVVLATSLAEKLHHHFPDARIDFLLRKGNESLLAQHPYIKSVLIWDKKEKFRSLSKLLKTIRQAGYDKVINVQRYAATGILTALSGAREKIGFDKNPLSVAFTKRIVHKPAEGNNLPHEIERNTALIRHFTDDKVFKPRLYPSPADYAAVAKLKQQPYVCIAPGSVWYTKQFPAEKWTELIARMPSEYSIYLLGGPTEASLCNTIAGHTTSPGVTVLAGKLSYLAAAALMQDAVMNYVNDSAPMHFASAMNAPVTAVYCSTIPAFGYGPLSEKKFLVETTEHLDCRPCGIRGHSACPQGHFRCAYTIRTSQLLRSLA